MGGQIQSRAVRDWIGLASRSFIFGPGWVWLDLDRICVHFLAAAERNMLAWVEIPPIIDTGVRVARLPDQEVGGGSAGWLAPVY